MGYTEPVHLREDQEVYFEKQRTGSTSNQRQTLWVGVAETDRVEMGVEQTCSEGGPSKGMGKGEVVQTIPCKKYTKSTMRYKGHKCVT